MLSDTAFTAKGILDNYIEIMKLMLIKGAELNTKIKDGRTILIYASQSRCDLIMQLLFDEGANVDAKDNSGGTVLSYATKFRHMMIINLLLDQ